MSIEVKALTKIYGSQKAIDNISFTINNGEIVGFLGPNGAGKSTTMKIITGYMEADEGKVYVDGLPVTSNSTDTKKKIGYLPEGNPLYYEMYVREYLAFIGGVHNIENVQSKIKNVIEVTGLLSESKKKIGQLSKGYKQRVGLAAALIHEPEVLILDEPTSGLDPNQIIEIRALIKKSGENKTVLFSSHILQEVEAICSRIIIINKGKIVADDSLSNLQTHQSIAHVIITFSQSVDKKLLENIEDVQHVDELSFQGNPVSQQSFKLQTSNPEIVRTKLIKLSLENNLNIVSLQNENHSLEDVFRNLTK